MKPTMTNKLGLAALVTAWTVWGSNIIGNALVPEPETPKVFAAAPADAASEKAAAPAPEKAAAPVEAAIGTLLAAADPGAGKKTFKKCKACHTTDKGGKNKVGPNLWDVVGNAKAAREGFKYSGVLKGLGGEWTYQDLNGFLTAPKAFAKGTKMSFAGLKKAGDRAAVIVFLRSLSDQPKPLP